MHVLLQTADSPFAADEEQHRTIAAFGRHRQGDESAAHSGDFTGILVRRRSEYRHAVI